MGKRVLYPAFRGGRLPQNIAAWLDAKAEREETTTSALIRRWVVRAGATRPREHQGKTAR